MMIYISVCIQGKMNSMFIVQNHQLITEIVGISILTGRLLGGVVFDLADNDNIPVTNRNPERRGVVN